MRSIILYGFFVLIGIWMTWLNAPEGTATDANREPAAVRNHYDFTKLSQEKRELTLKDHIARTFEVRAVADRARFQFGYLTYTDESQTVKTMCSVYSNVVFAFEADGEAHNGEKPEMKVTAPCKEDGTLAGEVEIPVQAIANSPPADGDMQFFEPNQISLSFKNIGEKWPQTWYLKGVELNGVAGMIKLDNGELDGPFAKRQARSFQLY